MELVSNATRSSLEGPFHGSFSKFLINGKRPTYKERAKKFHTDLRVISRGVLLIGRATWEICLNQSKVLPRFG